MHNSSSNILRCKLMLLGPGSAGKSTLIKRLMTGGFESLPWTDGLSTA